MIYFCAYTQYHFYFRGYSWWVPWRSMTNIRPYILFECSKIMIRVTNFTILTISSKLKELVCSNTTGCKYHFKSEFLIQWLHQQFMMNQKWIKQSAIGPVEHWRHSYCTSFHQRLIHSSILKEKSLLLCWKFLTISYRYNKNYLFRSAYFANILKYWWI